MSLVIKFYFTSSMLNMFRTLIHPSSGTCDISICITTLVVCSCFDVCWSFGVAGLGGIRVAGLGCYPCGRVGVVSVLQAEAQLCFSLPHGYHPNPATPKLQYISKQEHTTNVVIR